MERLRTDCFFQEPANEYRAKRPHYLTSHQLIDYWRCPLKYRRKMAGLVAERYSEALAVGSATHTLTLEGRAAFEREYCVGGPINEKTGKPYGADTKKFAEWQREQGKPALSQEQAELVFVMSSAVWQHEKAAALLQDGFAEGVVRADYCGVPCQIRCDWFNFYRGIIDLKTCETLDAFCDDAERFGYVPQLAFYRAVYRAAAGCDADATLIAVEKSEPHRVGVFKIGTETLTAAERVNAETIERLKVSRAINVWPTGYEEVRTIGD